MSQELLNNSAENAPDYPVPDNESKRQEKLEEYHILDTLPEEEFDSLVELAAIVTGHPISLMNLLDYDRQWVKAAYGLPPGELPRSQTVCQYTILNNENFEIENLSEDERFKDLPSVKGDDEFRSYSGYPLRTSDGYNLGALCVLDYKPRKLTEVQKRALQTIANEIVGRLELRKKQLELEKLNREKDQFLRVVNHDIKSPINGIISSAHYLQNLWEGDREELNKFLSMIEMSGRKLIHYTGELVSNSIEHTDSRLNLDLVKVDELVLDLIDIYNPLAKAKNIDLKTSFKTSKAFSLDSEKFKLIISNLISNALKFSKEGDVISINIEIEPGKTQTLKCIVEDSGIGIPKDFISTLFTKNKRTQRKGTQGEISTGMGLPIVKQYVNLHNGEIEVESIEGKGTKFTLIIPEN